MAKLDSVPGVEVTICVNGQPLQEYKNEDFKIGEQASGDYQASVTSSNYIEGPSGQEYTICLALNNPAGLGCPAIGFGIKIDGCLVMKWCVSSCLYIGKEYKYHIQGVKSAETDAAKCTIRNFKFEDINTVDDSIDRLRSAGDLAKDIGEIIVDVHRKSKLVAVEAADTQSELGLPQDKRLYEKELKGQAKSQGTGLSNAQSSIPNQRYSSYLLDAKDRPTAIFRFLNRSLDDLKALLIVPRSPSPEPEAPQTEDGTPYLPEATIPKKEDSQSDALAHSNGDADEEDDLSDLTPEQRMRVEKYCARKATRSTSSNISDASVKNENTITEIGIASSLIKTEQCPTHRAAIKRESPSQDHSGRARKRRCTLEKVTVDLTEDDDDIPRKDIEISD